MELEIVYIPVGKITPYERNARRHTPQDVDKIKASIQKFGFDDPIGIWGPKNIIVEGHGRLIAAKELGYEKVPCIRLDHLTDEQRRAYALAHNRTAELSAWDFGKLEEEIAALEIEGVDLSGLNFTFDDFSGGAQEESPESFKEYGEETETKNRCPRCGYEWN